MSLPTVVAPVAYDIAGAASASGLSLSSIRLAVSKGDLVVHYSGRKPLILAVDLADYVRSLPTQRT